MTVNQMLTLKWGDKVRIVKPGTPSLIGYVERVSVVPDYWWSMGVSRNFWVRLRTAEWSTGFYLAGDIERLEDSNDGQST